MSALVTKNRFAKMSMVCGALVVLVLCGVNLVREQQVEPVSRSSRFNLNETQLADNAKLASSGDMTAAKRLAN
jgi:hypothetical protein